MKIKKRIFPWLAVAALLAALSCRTALPPASTTPPPASVLQASPTPATPGLRVARQTIYYAIEGNTASALREQMSRLGPPDPKSGKIFDARTDWEITWRFFYQQALTGSCAIDRAEVDVTLTFTFPRWQAPVDAPPELTQKWGSYLEALTAHEEQHAELAIQGGQAIQQTLVNLPAASTCAEMSALANATAGQVFDQTEAAQVQYDQNTRHGATQGAVFP